MPYKNPEDKKAWARADREANPGRYRRYRVECEERHFEVRDPCACGCGMKPRTRGARYMAGHAPPPIGPPSALGRDTLPKATTSDPTLIDLAWAAGFLEGEGAFSTAKGASAVVAEQKEREPLDRLARLFGGTISRRKRGEWQWRVSGPRARGVMLTLFLLLSSRRQGQIARAF